MNSLIDAPLGVVTPRILHLPPDVHSHDDAEEAIELANAYGLADGHPLDESQQFTIRAAMGTRADGSWAAATVADFEGRQNGKNDSIGAREFWGLILGGNRLQIHTAHEFPTANESFLRLVAVFENYDDLRRKVARIRYANGEQGIELLTGQRLKYKARTGGSGRGFAKADLVVYDEAQHLAGEHVAASGPTRLANPNSQSWYAGSGGLPTSRLAWQLRKRAIRGGAGRLSYVEHTAEIVAFDANDRIVSRRPIDLLDPQALAAANFAYRRRNPHETYAALLDELGVDLFSRECLCIWDPLIDDIDGAPAKIPAEKWESAEVAELVAINPGEITIGFEVDIDGASAAIGIAAGDLTAPYVELVEFMHGVGGLPARLVELIHEWNPITVGCNASGPAGSQVAAVLQAFRKADIDDDKLTLLSATEYRRGCGGFYSALIEDRMRRAPDQEELDDAVENAAEHIVGDLFEFNRRKATVPLSPLGAVVVAHQLLPTEREKEPNIW